jgi:hypothetical protein
MPVAKRFDSSQRSDQVTFRGLFANSEKRIRCSAQRRHNHNWRSIDSTTNDFSRPLDGFGVAD